MAALPEQLLGALEEAVAGVPAAELSRSVTALIDRYRSDRPAPTPIIGSAAAAAAYAAYRMPATYAAASAALGQFATLAAGFRPRTQLDLGGGTGAAIWAAARLWPSLAEVRVLERSPEMLALGRQLAAAAPQAAVRSAAWQPLTIGAPALRADTALRHDTGLRADMPGPPGAPGAPGAPGLPEADLITMCYLLGELPAADREPVLTELAVRGQAVALIEPGTPAGYRRVLAARQLLIEAGLRIVAPCPHDLGCPVAGGRDWCHFAARTGRTALHRRLKSGALGYEDEKFSYLVAARTSWPRAGGRVLRHPRLAKGAVTLTRCAAEPGVATETVFKRDRELYRRARNTAWGDPWPPAGSGQDASPGPDAPG